MKILIINGPNINYLKKRGENYSNFSFKKIKNNIYNYIKNKFNLFFYNSNCEGKIVNFIQLNLDSNWIIINPAAFSHYSLAILDCLKIFKGKIIEIHFTNLYKREFFRKKTLISIRSDIIISGMKENGYFNALNYILKCT